VAIFERRGRATQRSHGVVRCFWGRAVFAETAPINACCVIGMLPIFCLRGNKRTRARACAVQQRRRATGRPMPRVAHLGAKHEVVVTTAATWLAPSFSTVAWMAARSVTSWSPSRVSSTTAGT
jgi:hypothetical protein